MTKSEDSIAYIASVVSVEARIGAEISDHGYFRIGKQTGLLIGQSARVLR